MKKLETKVKVLSKKLEEYKLRDIEETLYSTKLNKNCQTEEKCLLLVSWNSSKRSLNAV